MALSANTTSLGDKPIDRIGYDAMQLAGPGVFGPPRERAQRPDELRAGVEAYLRSLRVERLDLVYLRLVDTGHDTAVPLEGRIRAVTFCRPDHQQPASCITMTRPALRARRPSVDLVEVGLDEERDCSAVQSEVDRFAGAQEPRAYREVDLDVGDLRAEVTRPRCLRSTRARQVPPVARGSGTCGFAGMPRCLGLRTSKTDGSVRRRIPVWMQRDESSERESPWSHGRSIPPGLIGSSDGSGVLPQWSECGAPGDHLVQQRAQCVQVVVAGLEAAEVLELGDK